MHTTSTTTITTTSERPATTTAVATPTTTLTAARALSILTAAGLAHIAALLGRFGLVRSQHVTTDRAGTAGDASVVVIDDPDGTMRLVGVSGSIGRHTVYQIRGAVAAHPSTPRLVHLDVSAVDGWPIAVVRELETVFDAAERDGVRLRVVGLDPLLPTLPSGSHG